jgi:hypothetical protein
MTLSFGGGGAETAAPAPLPSKERERDDRERNDKLPATKIMQTPDKNDVDKDHGMSPDQSTADDVDKKKSASGAVEKCSGAVDGGGTSVSSVSSVGSINSVARGMHGGFVFRAVTARDRAAAQQEMKHQAGAAVLKTTPGIQRYIVIFGGSDNKKDLGDVMFAKLTAAISRL